MRSFSGTRIMAVASRVLRQISRDRRTLGMMIVMPAIIMLIFGFALGGQVKNIPIIVDNQDSGYTFPNGLNSTISIHLGNNVVSALQKDNAVKVVNGSFDAGVSGVNDGKYYASIMIPSNFSKSLYLATHGQAFNPSVQIYIDGTKPQIEQAILGAVQGSIQSSLGTQSVKLDEQFAFGGVQYSGLDESIPSVIGFVLTFLVLLISLIIVSRETTSGVLSRIYTTPLSAIERLLGYSIALLFLGIVMVAVVLGIGVGVFGAVVRGSIILLFFAAVLYTLAHVFLAVFLSNFARNELQAVQMAPLIALPSMALSGMLIPVATFPAWVQTVAKFVPMYYGVKLFEGIMLKGYGITSLVSDFAIVGGIALLFLLLAAMTVKDRIVA
jgi:ABC-2 type transport system permease protein